MHSLPYLNSTLLLALTSTFLELPCVVYRIRISGAKLLYSGDSNIQKKFNAHLDRNWNRFSNVIEVLVLEHLIQPPVGNMRIILIPDFSLRHIS